MAPRHGAHGTVRDVAWPIPAPRATRRARSGLRRPAGRRLAQALHLRRAREPRRPALARAPGSVSRAPRVAGGGPADVAVHRSGRTDHAPARSLVRALDWDARRNYGPKRGYEILLTLSCKSPRFSFLRGGRRAGPRRCRVRRRASARPGERPYSGDVGYVRQLVWPLCSAISCTLGYPKAGSTTLQAWSKTRPEVVFGHDAIGGVTSAAAIASQVAVTDNAPRWVVTSSEWLMLPGAEGPGHPPHGADRRASAARLRPSAAGNVR